MILPTIKYSANTLVGLTLLQSLYPQHNALNILHTQNIQMFIKLLKFVIPTATISILYYEIQKTLKTILLELI